MDAGFIQTEEISLFLFGLFPIFLGNECGQITAIRGFRLEGKAFGGSFAVAGKFDDFGGNFFAEFHIIERMFHPVLLGLIFYAQCTSP